jgi:hypothetical protein
MKAPEIFIVRIDESKSILKKPEEQKRMKASIEKKSVVSSYSSHENMKKSESNNSENMKIK